MWGANVKEEPEWLSTQRTGKAKLSFSGTGKCCQAWTRWEKQQMGLLFATSVEFRRAMGGSSKGGEGERVCRPMGRSQEKGVD